ncbi:MAG: class I mannose-6-phosphate isomerase [Bacteroidota bacterium]|nr:MAG: class I mannose-6-phosphate isomerase [Bacteroidota bacterium]
MNELYPLRFRPIIKDKIWGGSKLKNLLHKKEATEKSGESWEISGVEGDISEVANGFLAGNSLDELIDVYMGDLVGQRVFEEFGNQFPLLIKYIDASDDLSIQVHPNDALAAERHQSFGKTEMWYVVQADSDARMLVGFNQAVDKTIYLDKLQNNQVLDIMNRDSVQLGDVYFIPAGRIHAIGKGCLVAEIQQTSDITYRIYDFDRRDEKGIARELHTAQALDAIDFSFSKEYKTPYKKKSNTATELVDCTYFQTNLLQLNDALERDMHEIDSFVIYLCVSGKAEIVTDNKVRTPIEKGETVMVPAEIGHYYIYASPAAELLEVYIGNPGE